jgi:integrase
MAKRGGKQRPIGLGSVRDVPLKDARDLAEACRQALRKGHDPRTVVAEASGEMTFDTAARELIESMAPGWRNAKHRAQWSMTLLGEMPDKDGNHKKTRYDYCAPIRNKPVSKLTTEDALRVLKPLWQTRPATANRLRGRCERVWDFAKARAHCSGENPFRWRGHLDKLLPKRSPLTRGHHKAMPFSDVPAFVESLRAMQGVAPRALEFTILTAARSGETLGARWDEIDLEAGLWTVPAARMRAGKEHRVPLSDRAASILKELHQVRTSAFVFPGVKPGLPLSSIALKAVLRRAKVDVTTHGFRSSFRDWAGDTTAFARDVVEAALAHAILLSAAQRSRPLQGHPTDHLRCLHGASRKRRRVLSRCRLAKVRRTVDAAAHAATVSALAGCQLAFSPISKNVALRHSSWSALSTATVLTGRGPSSNVKTTSLSWRKSCPFRCCKPNSGPTVVSISTTRETPMASSFSHAAISLRALDAFELSDVVTPVWAEWALLWEACSDVTGQCAEDTGSTRPDAGHAVETGEVKSARSGQGVMQLTG